MKTPKFILIVSLTAGFAALALTAIVGAAPNVTTYNVNSTADETDANLNDPVCKSASGKCTLRAAVMQGNKQGGKIVIQVPGGIYFLTRTGAIEDQSVTGDLDVYGNVTIQGAGTATVIDGALHDRVFDLHVNSNVELKNLTVQNGSVQFDKLSQPDTNGGGIRARGAATLTNVRLLANFAEYGGGISNFGLLHVNNSTISNNHGQGGGIYNRKYSEPFAGEAHISNSTLSGNDAAIELPDGSQFAGTGGAIENENAKLDLSNSTLNQNHAGWGGGLANIGGGQSNVVNATFGANEADYDGGAIFNNSETKPPTPTVQLSNVTIIGNRAAKNPGLGTGGGVFSGANGVVTVRNSIIAKNSRYILANAFLNDDCAGELESDSYNLIGSNLGCSGFVNDTKGDRVGTAALPLDPKVGALAMNGGATKTYALLLGSTAIDRGNPNGCRDAATAVLATDQRGYARPVNANIGIPGPRCDIGAIEYNSPGTPTPVPSATPTKTPVQLPTNTATPTQGGSSCSTKPSKPALGNPTNNAAVSQTKINLNWSDVTCETKYKVRVKDAATHTLAFKKNVSANTVQAKTSTLPQGKTYKWFVKACNAAGCAKSAARQFSINP